MIRATAAVVLREWRVQRRYPVSMVNLAFLTPLYQLALPTLLLGSAFVVGGSAVGLSRQTGTSDLAGWIGAGVLTATLLVGAVTSVYETLEADRQTGVIEHSWASPAPRQAFVLGGVLTGSLFGTVSSIVLLTIAVTLLHGSFALPGVLLSLPVLLLMLAGNCGYSYLVGAAVLVLREADVIVELPTLLVMLFSGVFFPLTLLPAAARLPTYILPDTWELDLIRHLTLATRPLAPVAAEVAAAVATAAAWLAIGVWAFLSTERRLRAAGTLAQF
ncbi:ABC transporter permease [Trebonia sp.]|uniref:ABC transporter permease n=1 Tax=Trebonia sp. TaxID=2767075 RepID=UPI002633113E|nr:ABC transporter permease [Trebonia sp.]